jgi:tetratricopeptide (TPR) repeat protein
MSIAALILPFALLQSDAAPGPSSAQVSARFEQCLALVDEDAERGYEEAMAWAADGQSVYAYRCAAMALIAQDRFDEGARRLDSLGMTLNPLETALKAELFSQAGNAWLLAREPSRARASFTRALTIMGSDPDAAPDLYIDRARAYAMEGEWRLTEEDLNSALDLRPRDALALRLRAEARMRQSAFDLAEADANAAIAIEPEEVDNYLILGHIRESRRLGAPIDVR